MWIGYTATFVTPTGEKRQVWVYARSLHDAAVTALLTLVKPEWVR